MKSVSEINFFLLNFISHNNEYEIFLALKNEY